MFALVAGTVIGHVGILAAPFVRPGIPRSRCWRSQKRKKRTRLELVGFPGHSSIFFTVLRLQQDPWPLSVRPSSSRRYLAFSKGFFRDLGQ